MKIKPIHDGRIVRKKNEGFNKIETNKAIINPRTKNGTVKFQNKISINKMGLTFHA